MDDRFSIGVVLENHLCPIYTPTVVSACLVVKPFWPNRPDDRVGETYR